MNTIPLVKGNTQEEINTSLIALKKALDEMNSSSSKTDASVQSQIKQINELIDTINEQITDLQPVDYVASGNMQSVTSNAVAQRLGNYNLDGIQPTSSIQAEILSIFNNTSNYTPFSGHTSLAEEGYYIGFKHKTEGEFLFLSRKKVMFCTIENGVISSKKYLMYI